MVDDYVGLVTNNSGGNKIDLFLDRSLDYRATFDPASGAVSATAETGLGNRAPASGLPDYLIGSSGPTDIPPGTNRLFSARITQGVPPKHGAGQRHRRG